MKLSALLELAQYYKNKRLEKLNKSVKRKPIFEAYASSHVHRWEKQLRDNFVTSPVFNNDFNQHPKAKDIKEIKDTLAQCNINVRNISLYIEEIIDSELRYSYRKQNEQQMSHILDKMNNFDIDYFVKQDCSSSCPEFYYNGLCTEKNYRDMLLRTNILSFAELIKNYSTMPAFKLSEVKDEDLDEVTPKQARSKIYKDSMIFWEDTEGRLMMVSEGSKIIMTVHYDNNIWNHNKKILYLIKNESDNIPPFEYSEFSLENRMPTNIQNDIYNYIFGNYCYKFSGALVYGPNGSKDILGTTSTTIYTDDGKRTGACLPEIGKIYALRADKTIEYDMAQEAAFRKANNKYYNEELPALIEAHKIKMKDLVSKCKSVKEYTSKVNVIDNLIDYSFDMLLFLNDYLRYHSDDKWFKSMRDPYYSDVYTKSWMYIFQLLRNNITILIDICEQGLAYIADLRKYNSTKKIKENDIEVGQDISTIKSQIYQITQLITKINDNDSRSVFVHINEIDPNLRSDLKWTWEDYKIMLKS